MTHGSAVRAVECTERGTWIDTIIHAQIALHRTDKQYTSYETEKWTNLGYVQSREKWDQKELPRNSFTCNHQGKVTKKIGNIHGIINDKESKEGTLKQRSVPGIRGNQMRRSIQQESSDPSKQPSSNETWRENMKEVQDIWYFSAGPDSETDGQERPRTKRIVKDTAGLVQQIAEKYLPSNKTKSLIWTQGQVQKDI